MNMILLAVVVIVIAFVSWLCVGRLKESLVKRSIVDQPNERSLHTGTVPRGGGLVMVMFLIAALATAASFGTHPQTFLALGFLVSCWAGLSWWDDRVDLTPKLRFLIQFSIMALTVAAFGWVTEISINSQQSIYLGYFGLVATAIGFLWFTNLFNFMDGMDGLAATQTIIAALTVSFWLWLTGDSWLAIVCVVMAASSYGFLLHNWHPATIFMGDVGSISTGAFFATLIIFLNNRYQIPVISFVILFGVFVSDASVTIIRRLLKKEKIWLAHRQHFYQRAAALGFNHAHITIVLSLLMVTCAMLASLSVADHDRIGPIIITALVLLSAPMLVVHWMEKSPSTKHKIEK